MLRNYITIAIRNLIQHKLYAVNNIAGLALGPALEETFPTVEAAVRVWSTHTWVLANDKVFEERVVTVDPR